MSTRNSISPNRNLDEIGGHETQSEFIAPKQESDLMDARAANLGADLAADAEGTLTQADRNREVPRLREDNINPRKRRSLPAAGSTRSPLSSRMKKEYSKSKNIWEGKLPKNRRATLNNTMRTPEQLENVNRALRTTVGTKSELPKNVREQVERIDRTIQDFERQNEREHIVYTTLRTPEGDGSFRERQNDMLNILSRMAEKDPQMQNHNLTYDGYIPTTHNLGSIETNESEGREVVLEMHTRSGAYLGTSDGSANADHIVNRGRSFSVRSVQRDQPYIKADGTEGRRTIVQVFDITEDGRTTAK